MTKQKWWETYGDDTKWEPGQKYTYCPKGCCLLKVSDFMHCLKTGQVFKLGEDETKEISWDILFLEHGINTTGKRGKELIRVLTVEITCLNGEALESYLRSKIADWA